MIEREEPIINGILFVADSDLELIQQWPPEIRAIFDAKADRELAQRIAREKYQQANRQFQDDKEIPF